MAVYNLGVGAVRFTSEQIVTVVDPCLAVTCLSVKDSLGSVAINKAKGKENKMVLASGAKETMNIVQVFHPSSLRVDGTALSQSVTALPTVSSHTFSS